MSVTVSPPVRVFALLGVIIAAALGLGLFVLGRSAGTPGSASPPSAVTHTTAVQPKARTPARTVRHGAPRPTPAPRPRSGFPAGVDRAFRTHRVVVLVVYMPGSGVDAVVRKEARAGAISTGAGYVPLNALDGQSAGQLLAKTGVLPDPAVVVIRRPGIVSATLGVTDRETVVQAVAQAKKR